MEMSTMQDTLKRKNLMNSFLEEHAYSLFQNSAKDKKFSTLPLRNFKDIFYTGKIRIGRPPQQFRVLLDTSFADLWVTSVYCHDPGCSKHKHFDPRESTTFEITDRHMNHLNKFGRIMGFFGRDIVRIGNVVVKNQTFAMSQRQTSKILPCVPFEGILGLGYPTLATVGITPFFDNLMQQGIISEPVFAFYLNTKKKNDSVLMLGGVDHSYHKGKLNWIPVSESRYWQITMDRISMNGKVIGCSNRCQAILDTGNPSVCGPTRLITKIQRLIGARPFKGCRNLISNRINTTIPPVVFTINGVDYPMRPENYMLRASCGLCVSTFVGGTEKMTKSETWILGDVFLRLYVSVFDRGNRRIGLAPAV
ncbi:pregnancy-associated glycoprotein 2-like [Cervus elaphus]|uniref:pregnancy-associated glycoprotein 2-like n=1 Tax=Cervus elaphus TaxID=9860 RepID=UPI001CC2F91B|nr:pregnancy-associated glycoprotein 2-like [Cervus elaphus]